MTLTVLRSEVDNETFYAAKEIRLNGKEFKTPLPLIHPEVNEGQLPPEFRGNIVEVWKTFDFQKKRIGEINSDNTIETEIALDLSRVVPVPAKNATKCYFISLTNFSSNPFSQMDEMTCSYFLDQLRQLSDFITIPIIQDLERATVDASVFEDYKNYVNMCVESARVLNTKPIMAVVPFIPRKYMEPVAKLFYELELKCFCFDFNGRTLGTHFAHYMQFLKTLYLLDKPRFQESIIHAINLKLPSNTKWNSPFPAEDMILPAIGADFIGISHKSGGPSRVPEGRATGRGAGRQITRMNLLNPSDYFYYRIGNYAEFEQTFPNSILKPPTRNLSQLSVKQKQDFKRRFDLCGKSQEFSLIHDSIINNESVLDILNQKQGIQQDIRSKVKTLKDYVNTRSIIDFL